MISRLTAKNSSRLFDAEGCYFFAFSIATMINPNVKHNIKDSYIVIAYHLPPIKSKKIYGQSARQSVIAADYRSDCPYEYFIIKCRKRQHILFIVLLCAKSTKSAGGLRFPPDPLKRCRQRGDFWRGSFFEEFWGLGFSPNPLKRRSLYSNFRI